MKKAYIYYLLPIATLFMIIFVGVLPASAAEINPDPNTYSYGSTSEFSGSQSVTVVDGELANTGVSVKMSTVIIEVISVIGVATVIYALLVTRQRRRHYRYQK